MIWKNKSTDADDETVWIKSFVWLQVRRLKDGVWPAGSRIYNMFFVFFFPFLLFFIVITEWFLVTEMLKNKCLWVVLEISLGDPFFSFLEIISFLVQESNRDCRVCCTSRKCILIRRDRSVTIQRRRECDLVYFKTALSRWWSVCQSLSRQADSWEILYSRSWRKYWHMCLVWFLSASDVAVTTLMIQASTSWIRPLHTSLHQWDLQSLSYHVKEKSDRTNFPACISYPKFWVHRKCNQFHVSVREIEYFFVHSLQVRSIFH